MISIQFLSFLLATATAAPVVSSTKSHVIADVGYAKYRGIYNATSEINSWYGIRYAAAPVGKLRWQSPRPIEENNRYSKSNAIDATEVAPGCIQGLPAWWSAGTLYQPQSQSEDCLLLDVKVPASPAATALPVMVQIHGGGYAVGAAETVNPGDSMVYHSQGNLIYVSIQYRLGGFGFLGGANVAEHGTLNAGLLDQRLALQWINKHIQSFGGDPNRITIIGGSAGGGSVMNQMIMYGGNATPQLFQAAVAEYPWFQPYKDSYIQEQVYNELLSETSCTNLACLQSLNSTILANAIQSTFTTAYAAGLYGFGDFLYGPVVDGNIIQNLPSLEFQQGHFAKVPLLVDHDSYEGFIFSNFSLTTQSQEVSDLHQLFPDAAPSFFTRLFELYPRSDFNSTFYQRQTIFGDVFIDCPTYLMASRMADYNAPVYKLRFAAGNQLHGAMGEFMFSSYINPTGNNATLAHIMRDYYTSFAIHQDPSQTSYSGVAAPKWNKYTSTNFKVLDVNYTMIGMVQDADLGPRCDFLSGQSFSVRS